jgi:hypothetical protein
MSSIYGGQLSPRRLFRQNMESIVLKIDFHFDNIATESLHLSHDGVIGRLMYQAC